MSKRSFAACARKAAYPTSADAERAAAGRLGFYLCPICTRYHLTSSKPVPPNSEPIRDEKPTFDDSLLGRAKLKRPKPEPEPKTETATCLGKTRPDGRVRLKIGTTEFLSEPVQPASMRLELKEGVRVRVRSANGRITC